MVDSKRVYVENYGCTSNRHDLEIMLGLLNQAGHRIVKNPSDADILIINTCAVKEATQNRMLHRIISMPKKPLIISGCLPKIDLKAIEHVAPDYHAVLDPQSITRITSIVDQANRSKGNIQCFSDKPPIKTALPKIRLNPFIEVIQIAEGCLGYCSYCCTRFARGSLHSFPKETIVRRATGAIAEGVKEVWLTAQDTGAYGKDLGTNLVDLLQDIVQIDGDFRIRLGMMNPNFAMTITDSLCQIFESEKIFKFLHIPVQSGSNRVLKDMKRQYQAEEFMDLIKILRSNIPNLTLSTDIIVGYPTETNDDFQSTLNLVDRTRPDVTNISKYGPRPKTLSVDLDPLSKEIVSERSKVITTICSRISLERNQQMIGKNQLVVIAEATRKKKPVGRTNNYKRVILKEDAKIGTKTWVLISKAHQRYLEGNVTNPQST